MRPFQYVRPASVKDAISIVASDPGARFIAGGTNLTDLMKRGLAFPEKLVDINHLPLKKIEQQTGFTRIGALVLNSTITRNKLILSKYPLLVESLLAGASGQLRNMATVGGNLLQQTRCSYFYDTAFPCNKRKPESGCGALEGINRMHAIFGFDQNDNQKTCVSVNPSDMNVALAALEAVVLVAGPNGERRIPFADFHRLPAGQPEKDTNLEKNELILAIEIPDTPFNKHYHYLKVRDRASYAFALMSAGVALETDAGRMKVARLAMGGVAAKPWRLYESEKLLTGQIPSETLFRQAAEVALEGAVALGNNAYKLKLLPGLVTEALKKAARI